MIDEVFRLWGTGEVGTSNKLYLRFGSPEESKLTSLLKDIFVLRKVPGVKEADIKSLSMAKWAIQEYCKVSVKRPLWAARYCKAISSYKPLLDELIDILDQDTAPLEKVKKIVPKLEHNKEDLLDILSDVHSYEEGFDAFLDGIKNIDIKQEWREELMKEIAYGLPSEIAFWKESDVQIQVMQYYLSKTQPAPKVEKPNTNIPTESTTSPTIDPVNPTTPAIDTTSPVHENPDAKRQAKNKIRNLEMSNVQWQMMMLELLNSHPEIADYINQNWE